MPFPMVHLYIAYKILSKTSQIKNASDFIMGSLAPDSVQFRDNYVGNMKKESHLCVGNETWGSITNNHEWQENVLAFLHDNKYEKNSDFIYGYCSHILADIQNNINIWIPFKIENKDFLESGAGNVYGQELYNLDNKLYLMHPHKEIIWDLLINASGYNIKNVVFDGEINKMKDSILNDQFSNRDYKDISRNKFVTLHRIQEFIITVSDNIRNLMYESV